jgi:DivIVA domain-containing protein
MGEGHGHGHGHAADSATHESAAKTLDPQGPDGLLDPVAVRNQVFTVVRLREGYDLIEVDAFLGRVETTLSAILRENEELRTRSLRVDQEAQASPLGDGATRIIELAHEAAERAIAKAREDADAILSEARARAEQVERDALSRATVLHSAAAHDTHREALGHRIQTLHAFVADFDTQLKETLDGQISQMRTLLDQLHHHGDPLMPQPVVRSHAACDATHHPLNGRPHD